MTEPADGSGHRVTLVSIEIGPLVEGMRAARERVSQAISDIRPIERADILVLIHELVADRIGSELPVMVTVEREGAVLTVEVRGGTGTGELDSLAASLLNRIADAHELTSSVARFRMESGVPAIAEPASDDELFARAAVGDRRARDQLFDRFTRFANALARRFLRTGADRDDLEQVAAIGLVKAIDRFDPGFGVQFTTFAARTIEGELKRHLRDRSWSVRVPRGLQELGHEAVRSEAELGQRLGRLPSVEEVADAIDLDVDDVEEALTARQSLQAMSLDAPQPGEAEASTPLDRLPAEDEGLRRVPDWADLSLAAEHLTERDREILRLRFFEDLTQSDIAARIGVSQMHVSRLLDRTIRRLRELIESPTEPG